ncbi:MAG: hypothetical protein A3G41_04645 [Elusimicrobia bacterium RIFCSPLOWO2_12_FULL_59_9]|nr:MAG: hypothetical protein A3G41_04645 [Elusimicrobia bacterium RIFCSPLOWO2_12_FULL_59_9]
MNDVGIDFGTTNSCAAAYVPGVAEPVFVPPVNPLPSIVLYSGEEIVVGNIARKRWVEGSGSSGQTGVPSVKRLMWGKYLDVHLHSGDNVSVTDVAARILSEIHTQYRKALGADIGEAVIAVPIGFRAEQRKLLREAATKAGIGVKTFIHEPFAAVLPIIAEKPDGHYLVFDWGGGTLDITMVAKDGNIFGEVAVGSLNDVAGDEFDRIVAYKVARRFFNELAMTAGLEALSAPMRERLRIQCEAAKRDLSDRDETTVTIPLFFKGRPLLQKITRASLEDWIDKELEKGIVELLATFERSGVEAASIRELIMVGGTSKIPLLKKKAEALMPCKVTLPPRSEFLIAQGAAWASKMAAGLVLAADLQLRIPSPKASVESALITILKRGDRVGYGGVRVEREFYCTDWSNRELRLALCLDGQTHRVLKWQIPEDAILRLVKDGGYPRPKRFPLKIFFEIDENLALKIAPRLPGLSLEPCFLQDLRFAVKLN